MPKRNRLLSNAVLSTLEVIVTGLTIFFVYRLMFKELGAERIGIWSLVLASASLSRLTSFGLSDSIVKFVAKHAALNDLAAVSRILQTSMLAVGLSVGAVLLCLYPFAEYLLGFVIEASSLAQAMEILPWAMFSAWTSVLGAIAMGAFNGLQRFDLRCIVVVASMVCYAVLSVLLVNDYGLLGLAYAHFAHSVVLLMSTLFLLRRLVSLPLIRYHWSSHAFREMFSYGLHLQVVYIMIMLLDPATKALVSHFGGLAEVGYFEMASRMTLQLRGLIVTAIRIIVPAVANLVEVAPGEVAQLYRKSFNTVVFVSVPFYTLVAVMTPTISIIWIGRIEPFFVKAVLLSTLGWFVNTFSAPAYYVYMGTGRLRWNTAAHVLMAILNIALGWTLGKQFGANGVLIGMAVSLSIGSLLLTLVYHYEARISLEGVFSKPNLALSFSCVVGLLVTALLYREYQNLFSPLLMAIAVFGCTCALAFVPMWNHPIRKQMFQREFS